MLSQLLAILILASSIFFDCAKSLVKPSASTGGPCKKVLVVIVEDTDKPLAIFLKTLLDFTLDIFDLNEVLLLLQNIAEMRNETKQ